MPEDAKPVARKYALDATSIAFLVIVAALFVGTIYAAHRFHWFASDWQLAAFVIGLTVFCVALTFAGAETGRQSTIAHSRYAVRADVAGVEEDATAPATTARDLGIYLGHNILFEGNTHSERPARYKGEKHLMIFGPTRCGKSMSIIVPNLQSLRRSIILTDPKAELAAITLRHRQTMGETIVLNPFGVLTDARDDLESAGWNPLAQLDPGSDDFQSDAACIADALIDKTTMGDGGNSQFFYTSALNLTTALVMYERFIYGDKASLCNLRAMVCAPNEFNDKNQLVSGFMFDLTVMEKCGHAAIRTVAKRLKDRLTDVNSKATSAQDVIDTFMSSTQLLDHPRMKKDMERGGAIDFAALHRQITTIYVILPAEELRDQARWLRLFVNLALRKLYKSAPTHDAPATLPPILLMLDEFGNLGRLGEIVKGLNMGCFCRFQLMFFLQNLGQLTGAYKDELGSFFSNVGAAVTFKTGALDRETAEHLSKVFGDQEMRVQTQTERGGSLTPQPVPLRRAEDIARLQPQMTINMIEPCPWPMYVWTPVYAVMPRFNDGSLDPNPYFHG